MACVAGGTRARIDFRRAFIRVFGVLSRVYVILDETSIRARDLPFRAVARGLLLARPAALQYRAKGAESGPMLSALRELLGLRAELSPETLIYVNDRPDLASEVGADGVHVGQEDSSISLVRSEYPGLRVGVSTHNQAQFERALLDRPDYVALGPVFPTGSKLNPEPVVTLPELARLSRLARQEKVLLVAIGGITRTRVRELDAWADQVAVIADLLEGATGPSAEQRILENTRDLGALMMRAQ